MRENATKIYMLMSTPRATAQDPSITYRISHTSVVHRMLHSTTSRTSLPPPASSSYPPSSCCLVTSSPSKPLRLLPLYIVLPSPFLSSVHPCCSCAV